MICAVFDLQGELIDFLSQMYVVGFSELDYSVGGLSQGKRPDSNFYMVGSLV